jgi:hypothetical protein
VRWKLRRKRRDPRPTREEELQRIYWQTLREQREAKRPGGKAA